MSPLITGYSGDNQKGAFKKAKKHITKMIKREEAIEVTLRIPTLISLENFDMK